MRIIKKWKRRKPGIYLVRTDKHLHPARRENAYVGRSNNVPLRTLQHLGKSRGAKAKSWTDLNPRWHVLRLPWWLGWTWVLAPLEAAAILLLMPRYNHQLNKGNPRRVQLSAQARQRAERDAAPRSYHVKVQAYRAGRIALRVAGVLMIVAGLSGYLMTR